MIRIWAVMAVFGGPYADIIPQFVQGPFTNKHECEVAAARWATHSWDDLPLGADIAKHIKTSCLEFIGSSRQ